MAVYTKVSKVGIQSILSKYNVGKLIKYEEIQEGIENSNFKVTTTAVSYTHLTLPTKA